MTAPIEQVNTERPPGLSGTNRPVWKFTGSSLSLQHRPTTATMLRNLLCIRLHGIGRKQHGKKSLEIPRSKWKNTEIILIELCYELNQDTIERRTFVTAVMHLKVT